ncbi:MAG: bifunctional enoyl-CoA hydratase/phosphate acetyltransferase [Calditrichaeota bacterium]|nr:MAG: bifunctional enoyl-CoA hydratase/phosphate acetyltransferase [Calditrichota bacterium]
MPEGRRAMIRNFEQLMEAAIQRGPVRVALAVSQDLAALSALVAAKRSGLAEARLFGVREETLRLLARVKVEAEAFPEIEDIGDAEQAALAAVDAVKRGDADILMKGMVKTSVFLKCVLHAERGLRTGRLLSDVFVFQDPRRTGNQLVMITDGGVTLRPNLAQKLEILKNAVAVAYALGNEQPRVAVLSAVETVNPDLPSTVDAAVLAKMNERGQVTGCIVDGPLALDNAISAEAAKLKHLTSAVAGQADILLCPDIESANMLAKGTTYFAGFRLAHVIVGAAAPVLIPSRADTADAKLLSIALGALMCK